MTKTAMVRTLRLDSEASSPARSSDARSALAESAAVWIVGGLALVGAVVLVSVLALVFAATLVAAMIFTLFLMATAVLMQRPRRQVVRAGAVINARKVGHSWVAYGWDKDA